MLRLAALRSRAFFREVAELGELYVVVGNDANIINSKEKAIRSSHRKSDVTWSDPYGMSRGPDCDGNGWLDAEPEIRVSGRTSTR